MANPAGKPIPTAILGASGYAGAELLRICAAHPAFDLAVAAAGRSGGSAISERSPNLAAAYGARTFDSLPEDPKGAAEALDGVELVFLALPHQASAALVPELLGRVAHVVDLSAAYRLRDRSAYPTWYGFEHPAPELLASAVYGMPELSRDGLGGAPLIAAPGCYVTAATLALAPLVKAGLVEASGIVVDAASGVSGAGRDLRHSTQFCTADEDLTAYGISTHRHTPEMEQAIGAQLLFTPHLAPVNRGILATCYARANPGTGQGDLDGVLEGAYGDEPFVHVTSAPPSTKATAGSNTALIHATLDARTGWVVVVSALDNLGKGAAGQAVQCANAALGLEETVGLSTVGIYP